MRIVPINKVTDGEYEHMVGEVYLPGPGMVEYRIPKSYRGKDYHKSLGIWVLNKDGSLGKRIIP